METLYEILRFAFMFILAVGFLFAAESMKGKDN